MSKIRVWTSDGQWSDLISGLDKCYLIKKSIQTAYEPGREFEEGDSLEGFEIDGRIIHDEFFDDNGFLPEEWRKLKSEHNIDIAEAKSFIMPLKVLEKMRDKDPTLSAKYDQIISTVGVPETVPAWYCLMMRFWDE